MQKLRVCLLAAITLGAATLFYIASPAQADVDSVSGSATAIRIGPNPLVPGVVGSATEPTDGYGPITTGPVGAPGLPLGARSGPRHRRADGRDRRCRRRR